MLSSTKSQPPLSKTALQKADEQILNWGYW
uniref:Uncharacterized protein n=1 Tax=Arundo donax TaxID=35708 RepID=A0A0A9AVS3_ARUDO